MSITAFRILGAASELDSSDAGVLLAECPTLSTAWDMAMRLPYSEIPEGVRTVRVVAPDGRVPFERVLDRPMIAPITTPVAVVDWQDWRALWQAGIGLGISLELARELIVDAQHELALIEDDDRAALVDDLAREARDRAEGIDDQGPDWRHADPRHSLRYRGEDGL